MVSQNDQRSVVMVATFVVTILFIILGVTPVFAGDARLGTFSQVATATPSANIQFTGQVSNISADRLIVNGLVVLVDVANLPFVPQVSMDVYVEGVLQADGSILATIVRLPSVNTPPPTLTPTGMLSVTPQPTAIGTLTMPPPATATATQTSDNDEGPIIVIEGPVEEVNINVITIYDIDIVVGNDDPILNAIRIGDFIRVEGVFDDDDDDDFDDDDDGFIVVGDDTNVTVVIIAVNITYVDIDVYINDDDGAVWRDNRGECGNPPPPWAPAHGWRARCEGGGGPSNNPGRGRNNDDDDDDD